MPDSNGISSYPAVNDPALVGTYSAGAKAGGGYVWDDVLEYRVWCSPRIGAQDLDEGNDYYYAFDTYEKALECTRDIAGTESPLALILQNEYIDEPTPGQYLHKVEKRVTEWPVEFLNRPRRRSDTIPNFFSPDAPSNRLDILRGLT